MKVFVALLALVAVVAANPLPLVQLIVNVNAPADVISPSPVIDEKPEPIVPGPVNIVDNVDSIVVPQPVVIPPPVLPVVVIPEPVVLPEPILPEVVVPEEVIVEVPASVPAGIVTPVETVTPEEVIVAVPVVAPSVINT